MKKILLTAATVATLVTSTAYAAEDVFYVKGQVGWDKMTKSHGLKSKNGAFLGLGVGYYVMDNVRADLTFDHYFNPEFKGTTKINGVKVTNAKSKARADTLLVNGFVDLFDVSVANIFVGAGVGMSMISTKLTGNVNNVSTEAKAKKKNNFAYALHIGGSVEFAPGVNGELTYSYRELGKFKKAKDHASGSLKGHHVAAGVRFDI